jgi:ribonuclease P protein component
VPAGQARSERPSRENRVRKRAEFLEIQSSGARVSGDCLVFIVLRRAPGEPLRLGITASRKIGGAVQRSRARRLIREAFRAVFKELPEAIDIVVIVRKPLGERKMSAVLEEWQRALPRIRRSSAASGPSSYGSA